MVSYRLSTMQIIACIGWIAAIAGAIAVDAAVVTVTRQPEQHKAISNNTAEQQQQTDSSSAEQIQGQLSDDGGNGGAFIGLQPEEMSSLVEEEQEVHEAADLQQPQQAPPPAAADGKGDMQEDLRTVEFVSDIVFALENDSNWRAPQQQGE
ncbi:hypothetical protein GGI25_006159 [Coemansia spiralis]|uniref:Uncharacterized protein n=2 Tax=Coemansia TaxID=4863 RepID=A0A9W8G2N0_9FUNG|nr:hypothetical protein BX070DRAFT_230086 [Coemansia spiralis]KAJ1986827.1 hypothetical protein EDC05_006137 [Coemansia umbellata]KAJ2618888.1 hypothetical protein GGI26_006271 [Coemansia sp. RSA 1358]KAJ2669388.1 hypothetical protein GGI25_006159 [Coemansia spiralis]